MTSMARPVLIMAGGTGGHIYPGLAFARALQDQGVAVRWLGAAGGMETRKVPEFGIDLDTVNIRGVRGKGLKGWLTLPFHLGSAVWSAMRTIKKVRPSCAVSFGGYAAGPGGIAAWLRGIPLIVHEQNRVPGMTNKVLARLARKVLQAFPGTFERADTITCGNPVRREVVELPDPAQRFAGRGDIRSILITGGSQGAHILNKIVPQALALLPQAERPKVVHQSGIRDADSVKQEYQSAGLDADVSEFIEDMASAYSAADLVICRSGALTVSELAAAGVGALLVPFPHAVDDHQAANAAYLVDGDAAIMIRENAFDADSLAQTLRSLLGDRQSLERMALNSRALAVPDAAINVVRACQEWIH